MIRTLVRMLPRRLTDRVKAAIAKLVPPEKSDNFEHSLSQGSARTSRPSSTWARMSGT